MSCARFTENLAFLIWRFHEFSTKRPHVNDPRGAEQIMSDIIRLGYTTGIFDLFHVGHLNLLKNAKSRCDRLIVGVTTDELSQVLKGKKPVIPFEERMEIVRAIRYVDETQPEVVDDKFQAWENLRFNVIFKGDDWKGSAKWRAYEDRFESVGVSVHYFPYTKHTSSTFLINILSKL